MSRESGKSLLVLGCGYLGLRLVESARAAGFEVKAVSRNAEALGEAERRGAECFVGNVNESEWHDFAVGSPDFVVNCVSSAGGGLAGYRLSYIEGNRSLCKWAESIGFRGRAVFTSSVSVYPDAGGARVAEDSAGLPTNERGGLMLESERVFLEGMSGAPAFVLRLGGLYGPGRHLLLDALRAGARELPGWGDYFLNLIRIEDAASAVMSCLRCEGVPNGVYNIVDDEPTRKDVMIAWLAERLRVSNPIFTGKASAVNPTSRRLGENGRPANRRISNALFKERADWKPEFPSFREGFEDLMRQGDRASDAVDSV